MLNCRTMRPRRLKLSSMVWLAAAAAGCGSSSGNLKVTKISAAAAEPANVAVYLDVKDKQGRPIPGLAEKNFRVYEDGKLVTTGKGKRTLLEPKLFDTCLLYTSDAADERSSV